MRVFALLQQHHEAGVSVMPNFDVRIDGLALQHGLLLSRQSLSRGHDTAHEKWLDHLDMLKCASFALYTVPAVEIRRIRCPVIKRKRRCVLQTIRARALCRVRLCLSVRLSLNTGMIVTFTIMSAQSYDQTVSSHVIIQRWHVCLCFVLRPASE